MAGLPDVSRRTLYAAYDRLLQTRPDDLAHSAAGSRWTFADSFARGTRLAAGLRGLGVGHQRPVALMLDNSLDFVHLWMGAGLAGMIEAPVNTAYKRGFLTHILNDSGSTVLVVEARYAARVAEVAGDLVHLRTVRMPYFMVPRYVEFADALPKTPTQKIQKQALRDAGLAPDAWDREAAGIRLRRGQQ